jgi:hypothetical protein
MTGARKGAIVVLALRIAYGAGLIAAPGRLGRRWLGPAANAAPTQVPLRALGAREIILHAGAILAAVQGAPLPPDATNCPGAPQSRRWWSAARRPCSAPPWP